MCKLLSFWLMLMFPLTALASDAPVSVWGAVPPAATTAAAASETTVADIPVLGTKKFRDGLTIRERRAMGLTFRNVARVIKELDKSGEITEDTTAEEAAVVVASVLVADSPAAFQNAAIDPDFWDKVLAFLEKLIALILQFWAIFS